MNVSCCSTVFRAPSPCFINFVVLCFGDMFVTCNQVLVLL